jgi:hypothetical protein
MVEGKLWPPESGVHLVTGFDGLRKGNREKTAGGVETHPTVFGDTPISW